VVIVRDASRGGATETTSFPPPLDPPPAAVADAVALLSATLPSSLPTFPGCTEVEILEPEETFTAETFCPEDEDVWLTQADSKDDVSIVKGTATEALTSTPPAEDFLLSTVLLGGETAAADEHLACCSTFEVFNDTTPGLLSISSPPPRDSVTAFALSTMGSAARLRFAEVSERPSALLSFSLLLE
jgi:hypothetical protein